MTPDAPNEADSLSAALRSLAPRPANPAPVIRTTLPFYGAKVGDMKALARAWHREHPASGAEEVLVLADELWGRAIREEMMLASLLVSHHPGAREAFGLIRCERWGALVDNWETADSLAGRVLGPWVAGDPERRLGAVERLVRRRNPWLRRLGLVACVQVGRRTDASAWWPRVSALVLRLAGERRAAIPKAISWVLREHTRHCPDAVTTFLDEHGPALPAVAVREARNKLATGRKGHPPAPGGVTDSGLARRV